MRPSWTLLFAVLAVVLGGCASSGDRRWVRDGFDTTCRPDGAFMEAAILNAGSLDALDWSPFGAPERGWRVYAPRVAREIASPCAPDSEAFAAALARWQGAHGLGADGAFSPQSFATMKDAWQARRPFLALRAQGICPPPPDEATLRPVGADEAVEGKAVLLRPEVLEAFGRLRAAAKRELGLDARTLVVFSGYRSPEYDDARCLREQNCQGVVRAQCSAHRTGLALDLTLGTAPGYAIDASDLPNRLFQTQTAAYRWLVARAGRFGFVNYAFEPWHWEWAGQALD
jgi:D-alanyl-D-alanine carboxypeptidase